MDVDIDSNNGGDDLIYQIADDRFFMVVFINKAALAETRRAAGSLQPGEEVLLGRINCGEHVWIVRDQATYWLSVGDSDSKEVGYRITKIELDQLLNAEAVS